MSDITSCSETSCSVKDKQYCRGSLCSVQVILIEAKRVPTLLPSRPTFYLAASGKILLGKPAKSLTQCTSSQMSPENTHEDYIRV